MRLFPRSRPCRSVVAVLVWLFLSPLATPSLAEDEASLRLAPTNEFGGLVASLARTAPSVQSGICKSVFVVFIPGILGTKLAKADGTVVWGDGRPNARDLALKTNPDLRPVEALEEYQSFFGRTMIYKPILDALVELNLCRGSFTSFPYDWRKPLGDSARQLDTFLRDKRGEAIRGKAILFVAHSMGGLILKEWLRDHYLGVPGADRSARYSFTRIAEIIFVGTPHEGSPTALYNLMVGYTDINARWYENEVYKHLFESLHHSSFQFPSVFRLLPPFDPKNPTLRYCPGDRCGSPDETPINHFNADHWKHYDLASKVAPADQAGRAAFYQELSEMLQTAQEQTNRLLAFQIPKEIQRRYFFGDELPTIRALVLTDKQPGLRMRIKYDAPTRSGDGRVTMESARHFSRQSERPTQYPLGEEHGLLFADWRFRRAQGDLAFSS